MNVQPQMMTAQKRRKRGSSGAAPRLHHALQLTAPIGAAAVHDMLAGYLAGLERLVAHLDQVQPAGGPVS